MYLMLLGHKMDEPLPKWREETLRQFLKPTVRAIMLGAGIVWVDYEHRKDVDYKKWLGPDWKCSFNGAGLMVCNHSLGWMDILITI